MRVGQSWAAVTSRSRPPALSQQQERTWAPSWRDVALRTHSTAPWDVEQKRSDLHVGLSKKLVSCQTGGSTSQDRRSPFLCTYLEPTATLALISIRGCTLQTPNVRIATVCAAQRSMTSPETETQKPRFSGCTCNCRQHAAWQPCSHCRSLDGALRCTAIHNCCGFECVHHQHHT